MKLWTIMFLVLALTACAEQQNEYVFGAVVPLTGSHAFYGQMLKEGVDLAVEDLNAQGGINGLPVRVIFEDTAGSKQTATTVTTRLATIDNVDGIISTTTPMAGAIAPVVEELGIPFIYSSATNSFAEGTTFVFKDSPDATDLCKALVAEALEEGRSRFAIFGANAEFTHLCKAAVEEAVPGQLVAFSPYNPGELDFRSIFVQLQEKEVDALILSGFANDCVGAFEQMRELDYTPQLFIMFQQLGCGSNTLSAEFHDVIEGGFGADMDLSIDSDFPAFADFKARMEANGWTTQIPGSAMVYDNMMVLAQSFTDCGRDKECAAQALETLSGHQGPSGTLAFKGRHIAYRDVRVNKMINGAWTVEQVIPVEVKP